MWESIARSLLKYRLLWLIVLLSVTAFMGYHASRVQLSYDFTKTIPTDNPKYQAYQEFRARFGEDGNVLVVGIQTDSFFRLNFFKDYIGLMKELKGVPGVEDVLSIPVAVNLLKDTVTEKPRALAIFPKEPAAQGEIDSAKEIFMGLPFYRGLLYNPETRSWLAAVRVNKDIMNSKARVPLVANISKVVTAFGAAHNLSMHMSGLPLIRTRMATKVSNETTWFLLGSVIILSL
ncbi:MAG TPA: RND transporter, partial [Puia sp.]